MKLALTPSLVALALQAAVGAGFWSLSEAAYGPARWLDESWKLPLTYCGLSLAGPSALACASWARRWLHRVRLSLALPVVLVLCLPTMLAGTMASFTLACLRGWC